MLQLKKYLSVKMLSCLLYFDGLMWLVFSIWLFLGDRVKMYKGVNLYNVLAVLMLINFLIFCALAYFIFKRYRWAFYFTLSWLFVNLLLSLTDDLGLLDIAVLLLNFISILLILNLKTVLAPARTPEEIVKK